MRDSPSEGAILAVYFKQAFDSVDLRCILKSLKKFGFGPNFIRWMAVLNTDRASCVKNGGHVSSVLSMSNGVCQGCPISPQLFIIAVEILAQKIIQDNTILGMNPHNGLNPMKISQYADDTSFFLKKHK